MTEITRTVSLGSIHSAPSAMMRRGMLRTTVGPLGLPVLPVTMWHSGGTRAILVILKTVKLWARPVALPSAVFGSHRLCKAGLGVRVPPSAHCDLARHRWHVRLEEATPGRLRFSLRTMGGKREQMVFDVLLSKQSDRQQPATKIMRYKTHQQKFLHIPMGPKHLMGIQTYQQFLCQP